MPRSFNGKTHYRRIILFIFRTYCIRSIQKCLSLLSRSLLTTKNIFPCAETMIWKKNSTRETETYWIQLQPSAFLAISQELSVFFFTSEIWKKKTISPTVENGSTVFFTHHVYSNDLSRTQNCFFWFVFVFKCRTVLTQFKLKKTNWTLFQSLWLFQIRYCSRERERVHSTNEKRI